MRPLAALPLLFVLGAGCLDDGSLFGDEPCLPAFAPEAGSVEGQWTEPATFGPGVSWQPSPLPWADAERLDRLATLDVTLAWTNEPRAAADFGVAVGREGTFRYWNQDYQTSLGASSETLSLDRTELEEQGWTSGAGLDVGPSVSTGAFAPASPLAYTLSWTATFLPPPEGQGCGQ